MNTKPASSAGAAPADPAPLPPPTLPDVDRAGDGPGDPGGLAPTDATRELAAGDAPDVPVDEGADDAPSPIAHDVSGSDAAGEPRPVSALAQKADAALYDIGSGDLPEAPKDPLRTAIREGRGQEWIADHRAQVWIVGIGAMTIGSILCMMIVTIVLIITRTR